MFRACVTRRSGRFPALNNSIAPGAEASIIKVLWSELNQRMQELVMELQGPASQLDGGLGLRNRKWPLAV